MLAALQGLSGHERKSEPAFVSGADNDIPGNACGVSRSYSDYMRDRDGERRLDFHPDNLQRRFRPDRLYRNKCDGGADPRRGEDLRLRRQCDHDM